MDRRPGSPPTIESILADHGKRLYNLAYRICGDQDLAEDLLQESLIEIDRALPKFRGESSSYTWAYKITLRTCLRHSRGRNPQEVAVSALQRLDEEGSGEAEPAIPDAAPGPEDLLVEKALMAEIREKCHYFMTFKLTEEQRVALLLNDLFDFSYREMAFLLDVGEDVVRSRLSRARANLKRWFAKRCSWIDPANPCRCEGRAGYALAMYPSLRKQLSLKTDRDEYNREIAAMISRPIESPDDIIASFPFLDFKGRVALEKLAASRRDEK